MTCKGMNCSATAPDYDHSPECVAEHAAAIAGGRFVKTPTEQPTFSWLVSFDKGTTWHVSIRNPEGIRGYENAWIVPVRAPDYKQPR